MCLYTGWWEEIIPHLLSITPGTMTSMWKGNDYQCLWLALVGYRQSRIITFGVDGPTITITIYFFRSTFMNTEHATCVFLPCTWSSPDLLPIHFNPPSHRHLAPFAICPFTVWASPQAKKCFGDGHDFPPATSWSLGWGSPDPSTCAFLQWGFASLSPLRTQCA